MTESILYKQIKEKNAMPTDRSPISQSEQHKIGEKNSQLKDIDMHEDGKVFDCCRERQSQQSHLEWGHEIAESLKPNDFLLLDEATNHRSHPLHLPYKDARNPNGDQDGPIFQRSIQPNKSPLVRPESKRLKHDNCLSKSGANIKKSQILVKTRTIIENEDGRHSKATVKEKNYLRDVKNKNSYDQLMDKNLIQYLYTRQKKIFEEQEPAKLLKLQKKPQIEQSRQMVRKCPTYQLASRLKLIKRENKKFEIRADWRNTKCNIFDAISCEESRRLNDKYHSFKSLRTSQSGQNNDKENKPELQILKNRMTKLQETVYHKIPFLVEMGVKFKCKK